MGTRRRGEKKGKEGEGEGERKGKEGKDGKKIQSRPQIAREAKKKFLRISDRTTMAMEVRLQEV